MLKCAKMVTCRLDGTTRTFTFYLIPGDKPFAMPCYCASDKVDTLECLRCWRLVRASVIKVQK